MPRTTKHLKKHQFKKGMPSANPLGGKLHDPVFRAIKNIGRQEFREIIEIALTCDTEALQRYAEDKQLSVVQMGVVRALVKAALKGEWSVFKDIVEQLVGKNPDVVHVKSDNVTTVNAAVARVTDEELKKRIEKLRSDV